MSWILNTCFLCWKFIDFCTDEDAENIFTKCTILKKELKNNCAEIVNLSRRKVTLEEDLILAVNDILEVRRWRNFLCPTFKDLQKHKSVKQGSKEKFLLRSPLMHLQKWRQFVRIDVPVNLNFCWKQKMLNRCVVQNGAPKKEMMESWPFVKKILQCLKITKNISCQLSRQKHYEFKEKNVPVW